MVALLIAAAAACPSDRVIGLELKPWKARLLSAAPGSDEQRADMAALGIKTVPEDNDSKADCATKPVLEGIDVFDANLTGRPDKVVQLRFRLCKGTPDEWHSLRVAVLASLEGNRFCLLDGADLSADYSVRNRPCENPGELPMTLAFKEVIQKGRKVIETQTEGGSCSPDLQITIRLLALYWAEGFTLQKIFEARLLESFPQAEGFGRFVQRTSVTYTGAPPKIIHVEQCTEGRGCESSDNEWSPRVARYVFRQRYR
ncbi:MAG: hypothetical protein ACXWLM_12165 [Myxococcales bacterium]